MCAGARDVPQMMNWVVEEVFAKRLDGEGRTVTAHAEAGPLAGGDCIETVGELVGGEHEFATHDGRVLEVVALGDGGGVLIPVGKGRGRLGEHEIEPLGKQPKYVTHVTAVFERRPHGG